MAEVVKFSQTVWNRISQMITGWGNAIWNRMSTPYKDYNRVYSFLQTHTYVTQCPNNIELNFFRSFIHLHVRLTAS